MTQQNNKHFTTKAVEQPLAATKPSGSVISANAEIQKRDRERIAESLDSRVRENDAIKVYVVVAYHDTCRKTCSKNMKTPDSSTKSTKGMHHPGSLMRPHGHALTRERPGHYWKKGLNMHEHDNSEKHRQPARTSNISSSIFLRALRALRGEKKSIALLGSNANRPIAMGHIP